MLLDIVTWIISGISIIGAILNSKKDIRGFYFWIVANVAWVIIDFMKGIPAQSILFIIYTGITIFGIYQWKKEK